MLPIQIVLHNDGKVKPSFDSPRDRGVTTIGLGVICPAARVVGGVYVDRFFYERRP